MLDLNVILDVIEHREPFFGPSVAVTNLAAHGRLEAHISGHAITTLYYLTCRHASRQRAKTAIQNVLRIAHVAAVGHPEIVAALGFSMSDFEDAVTASAASAAGCEAIITRNLTDFRDAPVPAWLPAELLERL